MVAKYTRKVKFSNDTKTYDGVILNRYDWTYYQIVCGFMGVKRVFGDSVSPIKSVMDIVKMANFEYDLLVHCLNELKTFKNLLRDLQCEEFLSEQLRDVKHVIQRDPVWDRECGQAICLNRFCCIDRKIKNKRRGIALVRNGYRGCNVAFITDCLPRVNKLMKMMTEAVMEADFNLDWDYMTKKAEEVKPMQIGDGLVWNEPMDIDEDYVMV